MGWYLSTIRYYPLLIPMKATIAPSSILTETLHKACILQLKASIRAYSPRYTSTTFRLVAISCGVPSAIFSP
jgi:hypothetical protein